MDWKQTKVMEGCKRALAEEVKMFMIAYETLPEELHGYLSTVDQNVVVFNSTIEDSALKEVKKTYPTVWANTQKKKVYFKQSKPYLTLDGVLAYAHMEHKDKRLDITVDPIQVGNTQMIRATVVSELRGQSQGLAIVGEDSDLEKVVSSAVRKAFNYMGYGRFPLHDTKYKEHPQIMAFREFTKKGTKGTEGAK